MQLISNQVNKTKARGLFPNTGNTFATLVSHDVTAQIYVFFIK